MSRVVADHGLEPVHWEPDAKARAPVADVVVLACEDIDRGVDLVRSIKSRSAHLPLLLIDGGTGRRSRSRAHLRLVAALDAGADAYLAYPFDTREFLVRLHALVRRSRIMSRLPTD